MYGAGDKSELIGKNAFDLIAPEDHKKALAVLQELHDKGYRKFQEFKVVTRDGARKTIEMSTGIMKDDDGKPLGIVAISRDVPERQKNGQ